MRGVWLVRLLGWTWRIRVTHDDDVRRLRAAKQPIIFTLWHGQLLPLLYHHRGEGVAVLISEHADGEIIARIAESLGYRTVRGSTSRGAARALLGLARVVSEGHDLAITPDGPRGPANRSRRAALIVAQRTGAPIIGAAASTSSAWRLKSWDRVRDSRAVRANRHRVQRRRCAAPRPTRAKRRRTSEQLRRDAWRARRRAPVDDRGLAERVWYGGDALASTLRTALIPAERIFGGIVGARDILYDAGWLPARETPIPAVSVGNLTVGGTGKTPIAAWIARGLVDARRAAGGDPSRLWRRRAARASRAQSGCPGRRRRRSRRGGGRRRPRPERQSPCSTTRFSIDACSGSRTSCWSAPIAGRATSDCCRRGRGASRSSRCGARRWSS